jgi:hypothetical protein
MRAAVRSTAVEQFDLQRIALPQMMAVPSKGVDPPPEKKSRRKLPAGACCGKPQRLVR